MRKSAGSDSSSLKSTIGVGRIFAAAGQGWEALIIVIKVSLLRMGC